MTNDRPNLEPRLLDAERCLEASRTLLALGQATTGRRLASEALEALREIAERLGQTIPAAPDIAEDDSVAAARTLATATRALRALAPSALSASTLRRRRRASRFVAGAATFVLAAALLVALDLRPGMRARASSVFDDSPMFDASRAVDGNRASEWLARELPATLEVHLVPSRTIHSLTLWNGHNRWYVDRAARAVRIELVRDGATVRRLEGSFLRLVSEPTSLTFDVGREPRVDHVRVVVMSHFGLGSSLAELEIR